MKNWTQQQASRLRPDGGQSIVEFVIVLPFLLMLLLGIGQFGVAFHNYLEITDATRVGARAAAVKRTQKPCDPGGAAEIAIKSTVSAAQWDTISSRITCTAGANVGDSVTVTVKYPFKIGLPGSGALGLPAINVSG